MHKLYIATNETENYTALVFIDEDNLAKASDLLNDYAKECNMQSDWTLKETCITDVESMVFDCDHLIHDSDAIVYLDNVKQYLFTRPWTMQLFIATSKYDKDAASIAIAAEVADGVDLEKTAMLASKEFCLTEEGKQVYTDNHHCFNWGDFDINVPNSICTKYGIRKINSDIRDMFDFEQQLVSKDDIFPEE